MIYYLKTKASSNPLRPRLKGNNKKRSDDMDKKIKGVIVSEYPFEDNGKIINEGSHSYLLKNCDEYRKLYEAEIKNRK